MDSDRFQKDECDSLLFSVYLGLGMAFLLQYLANDLLLCWPHLDSRDILSDSQVLKIQLEVNPR